MEKKNILIITTILPYPLNSGGAQAQFNMVNELRKKHNIFMLFTEDQCNTLKNMRALQELWPDVTIIPYRLRWQLRHPVFIYNKAKRALQTYLTPRSQAFLVDKAIRSVCIYYSSHLKNFINSVIEENRIDIVQVEFVPAMRLVYDFPPDVKTIFIQHEIAFVKNKRYLQNFTLTDRQKNAYENSKKEEIRAMNAYDTIVTLTQADKDILVSEGVTSDIFVSPAAVNAIEHDYEEWNGRLTFVGSYNHIPNREGMAWVLEQVAPYMAGEVETLDIVGQGWDGVRAPAGLNTRTLGFVDDLHDAIGGTIMIVPILSGSGMRMKILEAAANSVPIVTTTVGVEGLDFEDGDSCLVADTPDAFADAVKRLARDTELRRKIGTRAHEVYEAKYTAKALADVRSKVYA